MINIWRKIKFRFQRFYRGYSDYDLENMNEFIIDKIYIPFKKYVKNEEERGLYLPFEFATDPARWLDILKKIDFSLTYYVRFRDEKKYFPTINMNDSEIDSFVKNIDEGFTLLGKYLRNFKS